MSLKRAAALLATFGLAALSIWLWPYGWEQRHQFYRDYTFSAEVGERLGRHPGILYAYGREAEARLDRAGAAEYYRRAVAHDPLHLDAWLRLAEIWSRTGSREQGRRITIFSSRMTAPVVRWKWAITLLAQELDLPEIFDANLNFLLTRRLKTDDALFLLETRVKGDVQQALAAVAPANRPIYLKWAMRWQRLEAARVAWEKINADGAVADDLLGDYVHFLLSRKQLQTAHEIWQRGTGLSGVTNAGFEAEPTGRGFDWSAVSDTSGKWKAERAPQQGRQGSAALRVRFAGRDNVAFHHLRQILPVAPLTQYRLSYWWKSQGLTTDQTPFVEVVGYEDPRLRAKGPAIPTGTQDWQPAEVVFRTPDECHAVIVVLRRLQSRRFDSSIDGILWLDDFQLSLIAESDPQSTAAGSPAAQDVYVKASVR